MNHFYKVLLSLLFIYTTVNGRTTKKSCSLTIPFDIPKNEPLYLLRNNTDNRYGLLRPKRQETHFTTNTQLILACPGKNNQLKLGDNMLENRLEISCISPTSNRFGNENFDFNLKNINCTKSIHADLMANDEQCANRQGTLHTVGFTVKDLDRKLFLPIYELCYDESMATAIWSRHIINGNAIGYNVKESERRDFKATGIPASVDAANAYRKSTQLEHLISMLGVTQKYFNATSFLARGHLTPDADFVFPSAQFSTYFLMNAVPQFQSINGGNWLRVESLTRRLAEHFNNDLTVYTGVYNQLKLKNSNGQGTPLYLAEDNRIMVPQWIWKVLKNEGANSAIVFVTLNNPFADANEINEFCTNVCDAAYLSSKHFQNSRKGYTFCCELADFKMTVKSLPDSLTAKHLIRAENVFLD